MHFKGADDVTNCLVNTLDNCISLRVSGSDRFFLHSIIIQHLFELMSNEFRATFKSDLCWPRVPGKPFLFGNVCDSDCWFVVILMDFKPTGCGIYHSDTLAYKMFCPFLCVWTNEINAHFVPRDCFCFLLWEVSTFFGRPALVQLTSRADCHRACDLISYFWPPKVFSNDFFGLIDTGMSKDIMIPLDDSWL
jgi:hypothetical protein